MRRRNCGGGWWSLGGVIRRGMGEEEGNINVMVVVCERKLAPIAKIFMTVFAGSWVMMLKLNSEG